MLGLCDNLSVILHAVVNKVPFLLRYKILICLLCCTQQCSTLLCLCLASLNSLISTHVYPKLPCGLSIIKISVTLSLSVSFQLHFGCLIFFFPSVCCCS